MGTSTQSEEVANRRPEPGTALNLGCGRKRREGALNLDRVPELNPDVTHDLDKIPWPLADNQFGEVYAEDVLAHCTDVIATMEEIHRVCQDHAIVRITTPHFSSANSFVDPTHLQHFSYFSFDYFTDNHEFGFYSKKRFRRHRAQIVFLPTLANKLVWRLANRYPAAYERRWAWLFPA
ncbi:MAG TPA: methyltransferase domain-containing protein [Candidatus Binataceae bacterium]|nr:methyltransferase domain-containing protein [Candidatus Binataceae bacterium]